MYKIFLNGIKMEEQLYRDDFSFRMWFSAHFKAFFILFLKHQWVILYKSSVKGVMVPTQEPPIRAFSERQKASLGL